MLSCLFMQRCMRAHDDEKCRADHFKAYKHKASRNFSFLMILFIIFIWWNYCILALTVPGNAPLLYKSKGKDHVPSTSQKAGLTGWYKKFLFLSTTTISKPVFQEVYGTVILFPFPDRSLVILYNNCTIFHIFFEAKISRLAFVYCSYLT